MNVFGAIGAIVGGLVILLAGIFGLGYYEAWWLRGPGVAIENARTDVVHQTNQYVTSQQAALNNLMNEYFHASDAQKPYLIVQMHAIRETIPADRVPTDVANFLAAHPRSAQ